MNTLKFRTNIKCTGCLSKVGPSLNEKIGEGNWDVDLLTLKKTLTVHVSDDVTPADIVHTVKTAGFDAEELV